MREVNLEGLKELAERTRFEEVRELCYGLIEKFKEFQRENEGSVDLEDSRQKIGGKLNHALKNKLYNIL